MGTIKHHKAKRACKVKMDILFYFKKWKQNVEFKKYDQWCENNNEELMENYYAQENNMDSNYWCWNCKYSECDRH